MWDVAGNEASLNHAHPVILEATMVLAFQLLSTASAILQSTEIVRMKFVFRLVFYSSCRQCFLNADRNTGPLFVVIP